MTSRPGSVAADSNVLLSAVAGHAARRVFSEAPDVRILTTLFDFFEVEEYLPAFAEKYGLSLGKLRAELPDLPIEVYGEEDLREPSGRGTRDHRIAGPQRCAVARLGSRPGDSDLVQRQGL